MKRLFTVFAVWVLGCSALCAQTVGDSAMVLIVGTWEQTRLETFDADGQLLETECFENTFVTFSSDSTCVGLISFNGGEIVPTCPFVIVDDTLLITSPFVVRFQLVRLDADELVTSTENLSGNGNFSICYYTRSKDPSWMRPVVAESVGRLDVYRLDGTRVECTSDLEGLKGLFLINGQKVLLR